MKRFLSLAAIGLALSISGSARADSITSTITAYSAAAGELTGTVTVDTMTGQITAVDLAVVDGKISDVFDTIHYQEQDSDSFYVSSYDDGGAGSHLLLIEFTGTTTGFTINTPICTEAYTCGPFNASFFGPAVGQADFFSSGTPSVTPEPSSLALLGSGVLGIAGMVRRRFVRT